MGWSDQIFNYCERGIDPTFWAEPLNALSNAAFLLAALSGWRRLTVLDQSDPITVGDRSVLKVLIILVGLVGIGSFTFHTFATRWALLADVLPITAFMALYLYQALRRFLCLSSAAATAMLPPFLVIVLILSVIPCAPPFSAAGSEGPCLNGSLGYAPALAGLIVVGSLALRRGPEGRSLLVAAALFSFSLFFRTLDRLACDLTIAAGHPWGTHAVWHVINAIALHHLIQALLARYQPEKGGLPSRDT